MADCEETLRELDRFLDGEISDDARAHIHHHLEGCVDCYQAFDFHAELKIVIARKCNNDEMPDGLMDRIQQCFQSVADEIHEIHEIHEVHEAHETDGPGSGSSG